MVFLCGLGEDVKEAFLRECEAAYIRYISRVSTRFGKGVGMGLSDRCC